MQSVGALRRCAAGAAAQLRLRSLSSVASVARLKSYNDVSYKAGDILHGYEVTKVTPVPELHLTAVELRHSKTNAHYLHVARADSNNVFSIGFRTPPKDSSGVTHVLEHVSLCGSKKYPCRDPFFKMLNRSLATYMNAWTASDYTMYPFSTQNAKDFKNLLSVYLDAAFFPNLKELDFKQEGWRLEHEIPTDPSTPLVFKGVVWNEMKGALSDVDRLFCTRFQQALYPGTTYGSVSGGDPPVILSNLTVDVLRNFHRAHYHPSNSRIYTYGDLPLESHLEYIAEHGLNHFDQITPHTSVNNVHRWTEPKRVAATCPPDPMSPPERQTRVSVGWALPREDPYESFATRVLATLLVEGSKSPFYQALIESHIGTDYSPNTGLDTSTKEPSFCVGLQGLNPADVEKVERIIHETIEKTIATGFENDRVEAILHQIELSQRHQTSSFGLSLGASLMSPWIHETSIEELLQVDSVVKRFREDLAKGAFLEGKLQRLLKDNHHRLTFVMSPDAAFVPALQEQEEKQLEQAVSALTNQDKDRIYQQGLELLKEQEKAQDASALPTLHIDEIDRKILTVEKQHLKLNGGKTETKLQLCVQPTNGVAYVRAFFDTACVPPHLQPYLPLFGGILASMGAGSRDYREQGLYTKLWTGGISVSPLLIPDRDQFGTYRTGLMVGSRSLQRNVKNMFGLLADMITDPHLNDTQRLLTLHKMIYTNMANGVADSGHSFAVSRASSALSPFHATSEVYSGLTQIDFLRALGDSQLEGVLDALKQIASSVFRAENVRCAINVDQSGVEETVAAMELFVRSMTSSPLATATSSSTVPVTPSPARIGQRVYQSMPVQVNYVAETLPSVPPGHPDNAPLKVLTKLLSAKYLHREIREKGGAYGGGLGLNSGVLGFYSYRDPAVDSTLRAFESSAEWVQKGNFEDSDIDEAKLSLFQKLDAPVAPGSKGMSEFVYGTTDAQRQTDRDRLFAVQREDLQRVAGQYLKGQSEAATVVIGPIEGANEYKGQEGWTVANTL
eukprot:comp24222_c3_seq1/m.44621 comp24222_c3_seq1/g.44621  ORF comp24222_c3_seq1/g.44621 comp24222_c3_seq1/m.44621 type:complete len:1016 (-) comp24222_c3_seq1:414-3461(-)